MKQTTTTTATENPSPSATAARRVITSSSSITSVFGLAVGCDDGIAAGRWNRCWIVDMGTTDVASDPPPQAAGDNDANSKKSKEKSDGRRGDRPTCVGGSSFDVMLESESAKIAVDRVIDLDNGIHEMIFFVRKRGSYNLCIDAVGSHDKCVGNFNFRLLKSSSSSPEDVRNISTIGKVLRGPPPLPVMTTSGAQKDPPRTPQWPKNQRCVAINFTRGVETIPVNVSCRVSTDRDRFRFGGWVKLLPVASINNTSSNGGGGGCDGVHCTGSPLPSMEGWIWASDVCIVHIYSFEELHLMLNKLWVVGWGGSTMKQPMSNLLEYYLRQPIFKFFMAQLDHWKSKKKAGFFSYRQWSAIARNSHLGTQSSWNMLWGGCPGLMAPPSSCSTTVGMRYWPRIETLVGNRDQNANFPNAILLDHFVWRWPMQDEVQFSEQSGIMFEKLAAAASFGNHTPPLLVWHTGPSAANNDMSPRPDHCGQLHWARHLCWTIEDDYDLNPSFQAKNLLLISRDQVTLPLHFGNTFVHFGVHYGASEGMCNTGHARSERYQFAMCVRRTWGDDAVIIMWLNAIEQHATAASAGAKRKE
jgi:hypothetical protein